MQPKSRETPKPPAEKRPYRIARILAPGACRRCGERCACSEDELDAGGPA